MAGALVLSAAACSKTEEPAASSGNQAQSSGSTTSTPGGSKGTTSGTKATRGTDSTGEEQANIDKVVYFNGLRATLGAVTFDDADEMEIAVEFENLSDTELYASTDFQLEADGSVVSQGQLEENNAIVAKSKAKGAIVFDGIGGASGLEIDLGSTMLVIGNGTVSQVKVQLDGNGDDDVTNTPIEQEFAKKLTIGAMTFDITKAEIRFDALPYDPTTADAGKAYLVLTGTSKNTSTDSGFSIYGDRFVLVDADGEKTTAEGLGKENYLEPTKSDDKFYVLWEVDADFAGEWSIEISGDWGPENAEATATEKITLTATAASGGAGSTTTTKAS